MVVPGRFRDGDLTAAPVLPAAGIPGGDTPELATPRTSVQGEGLLTKMVEGLQKSLDDMNKTLKENKAELEEKKREIEKMKKESEDFLKAMKEKMISTSRH